MIVSISSLTYSEPPEWRWVPFEVECLQENDQYLVQVHNLKLGINSAFAQHSFFIPLTTAINGLLSSCKLDPRNILDNAPTIPNAGNISQTVQSSTE